MYPQNIQSIGEYKQNNKKKYFAKEQLYTCYTWKKTRKFCKYLPVSFHRKVDGFILINPANILLVDHTVWETVWLSKFLIKGGIGKW